MKDKKKLPSTDLETLMPLLIGIWRRFHKLNGPPDVLQTREFRSVVAAVQTLKEGLETGDALFGEDYFSQPELLGAYLLYQWVVHYQQGLCLINEIPSVPKRVLDICSGPSPMGFAALRHGAHEVISLDRNMKALELGAEVCGRYGYPLTIRRHDCLRMPLPVEGTFDLIIVSHALLELFPRKEDAPKQLLFIQQLLKLLRPTGYLLLVDSSLLHANRHLLNIREALVEQGIPVQAPCVWRGECPSLKMANSPCYAQREFDKPYLIKEIQRAADINLGSLKMTYVIFRSPQVEWPALRTTPLYRVISPPIESQQGKRFYLCGTDGKKDIGCRLSTVPETARAFNYLKRGELIQVDHAFDRANHYDIMEGTQVRIEAALNKPLPDVETDS